VPHILIDGVEQGEAAGVAVRLARLRHAAERAQRSGVGGVWSHAACDIVKGTNGFMTTIDMSSKDVKK
jgi:hypothetical protein